MVTLSVLIFTNQWSIIFPWTTFRELAHFPVGFGKNCNFQNFALTKYLENGKNIKVPTNKSQKCEPQKRVHLKKYNLIYFLLSLLQLWNHWEGNRQRKLPQVCQEILQRNNRKTTYEPIHTVKLTYVF